MRRTLCCRKHFREQSYPAHLLDFIQGNSRSERVDSVTQGILESRYRHHQRCEEVDTRTPELLEMIKSLKKQGLGSKRKRRGMYEKVTERQMVNLKEEGTMKLTMSCAGGNAKHLASVAEEWPIFEHLLPEIAFAGHSNSGKSTLVNAMVGVQPRTGPASTSERAGWTDQICFYQLGKRPPVLNLVDLPGYGHAIANSQQIQKWKKMTRDYMKSRMCLSRCCILVDCTRGFCGLDKALMEFLTNKCNVPWQIVLTKTDLLSYEELARSITVVETDLKQMKFVENRDYFQLLPVSASTGAGINKLWSSLTKCANMNSVSNSASKFAVREHKRAFMMRRI